MSRRERTCAGALSLALALASGCEIDMADQPRIDPLAESALFEDGLSARPSVAHTVSRSRVIDDEALVHGTEHGKLVEQFPLAIDAPALSRGQERFGIYCEPCHGALGDGTGMIVQ